MLDTWGVIKYSTKLLTIKRAVTSNHSNPNIPKPFDFDAVRDKNLRDIVKSNRLFHQTLFERCGNDVISGMIDQLRKRSHVWQHYIVGHSRRMEKTIKEHKMMVNCIRKQDVVKLKEVNETHLASGFQSYMEDLTVNND